MGSRRAFEAKSKQQAITIRMIMGANQKKEKEDGAAYFSGTYIEDRDAPIPGVPCLTGLFVTANSPK
jgi:hypothetical protein